MKLRIAALLALVASSIWAMVTMLNGLSRVQDDVTTIPTEFPTPIASVIPQPTIIPTTMTTILPGEESTIIREREREVTIIPGPTRTATVTKPGPTTTKTVTATPTCRAVNPITGRCL